MTNSNRSWDRYRQSLIRYEDLGFSLDISRMTFGDRFFEEKEPLSVRAMEEMRALEAGAIANPDENRQVGHYWLRNSAIAPTDELRQEIASDLEAARAFALRVHGGDFCNPLGRPFKHVLLIGIGGSALGPQFVADALTDIDAPMTVSFFDNTDPDGFDRVLRRLTPELGETLAIVISKSGGTPETRNGMLEAAHAYRRNGLNFAKHAVAVTGVGSKLDELAESEGWLHRFPMADWVGGRTSVMSTVGLLPMFLLGIDVDALLAGAAAMDEMTRTRPTAENAAMALALMWHHAGNGCGEKDMVVIPYKDRLVLLSKYLQQLVMESLGKELDRAGHTVNQGIAVYGNKGSTDQHAYVQQLRDGVHNFFATFIEVRKTRDTAAIAVEAGGATSGDYLQGFLRGTRAALAEKDRESVTISIAQLDAFTLGTLIALFERAVTFYASFVDINAYHQPGVQAGKEAAGAFLDLLERVHAALTDSPQTADDIAATLDASSTGDETGIDPEMVYHCLIHLDANDATIVRTPGKDAGGDTFAQT